MKTFEKRRIKSSERNQEDEFDELKWWRCWRWGSVGGPIGWRRSQFLNYGCGGPQDLIPLRIRPMKKRYHVTCSAHAFSTRLVSSTNQTNDDARSVAEVSALDWSRARATGRRSVCRRLDPTWKKTVNHSKSVSRSPYSHSHSLTQMEHPTVSDQHG